jgi:hypothetical protein
MPQLTKPTVVYHADWGSKDAKRWCARAALGADGRYNAFAPKHVGNLGLLIGHRSPTQNNNAIQNPQASGHNREGCRHPLQPSTGDIGEEHCAGHVLIRGQLLSSY